MSRTTTRVLLGTLITIMGLALSACQGIALPGQVIGKVPAAAAAGSASTYQTSPVERGNISLGTSGNGKIVTANSVDLGFSSDGTVGQVNVQVGDQVQRDQILATLNDIDQLKLAISTNQVALETAQKTLNDYQSNATGNLAQALSNQAQAQQALATAQQNLHQKGDPRCAPSLTQQYYFAYLAAQSQVNIWENHLANPKTGYGYDYIMQQLIPLRDKRDQAYINYTYCQGYTDQEIAASQANYQAAQANVQITQAVYQSLKTSNGLDPATLAIDKAAVANAQAQIAKAQSDLASAMITAPFNGTVTAVNGQVGQAPPSGAFITIADLTHPLVLVNIDETDLENFKVGCSAQVTFDSLPGQTFPGTVAQVYPSLVSVQNVNVVQGLVALTKTTTKDGTSLPLNLPATVNVTCQQAQNVLIVPIQALHQTNGTTYVYTLNAIGQPVKQSVVVGLESSTFAEIKSGLNQGEQVITSSSVKLP